MGNLGDKNAYVNQHSPLNMTKNLKGHKVISISVGGEHSLFLCEKNVLLGVGNAEYGQLSTGKRVFRFKTPIYINSPHIKEKKIIKIAAGGTFSTFLSNKGVCFACGSNYKGQIGQQFGTSFYSAIAIKNFPRNVRIIDVKSGSRFSIFHADSGHLYRLGVIRSTRDVKTKDFVPRIIKKVGRVRKFCCGRNHCLMISEKGAVWGLGELYTYWSRKGEEKVIHYVPKHLLPSPSHYNFIDVKAGWACSYILGSNGSVYSFGENRWGECRGDGKKSVQKKPFLMKKGVVQIEVGSHQLFMFNKKGQVYCVGHNLFGSLCLGHLEMEVLKIVRNKNIHASLVGDYVDDFYCDRNKYKKMLCKSLRKKIEGFKYVNVIITCMTEYFFRQL